MANCANESAAGLIRDDGQFLANDSQSCDYVLLSPAEFHLLTNEGIQQKADLYPLVFSLYLLLCLFLGWIAGHQR